MKRRSMALAVVLVLAASAAAEEATTPKATAPDEMIAIPGGPFFVGAKGPPIGSEPAGAPPGHTATVVPFSIDRTEVTAGDFAACIRAGACRTPKFLPG